MGFNCLKATDPLRRSSLLFTTKFPNIPDTHLIDLGRMKVWVDLGATKWFWIRYPWIGYPAPWESSACKYDWSINIYQELTDCQTSTDGKTNKNKNQHCFQLSNAGPPDKSYLYYPHVEGVTQKASLLPAFII